MLDAEYIDNLKTIQEKLKDKTQEEIEQIINALVNREIAFIINKSS